MVTSVGIAIIGTGLLLTSHAATPTPAQEAESGTLQGQAGSIQDTTASGNKAVIFGNRNIVHVSTFGAKGDGITDDTAAIQSALNSLKTGQTLQFDTGKTYNHNAVLRMTVAGTAINGSATIQAINEQASAFEIAADNVTINGPTFKVRTTTQRWSTPAQTMIYLNGHSGAMIKNVLIDGSPSAGFFAFGAHDYKVQDITVQNTRADAIHNTGGSYNATITRPIIQNVGDDGVAVISYANDGAICHDITVTSPRFYGSTNGRAYSVVGGNDIIFTDIYADSSNAASIYIGSEGNPYYTYGTQNVRFIGGVIKNANMNSSVDHGAILILGGQSGKAQSNITIRDMAISNTRASASRQISLLNYAGSFDKIQLDSISITGGGNVFGTLNTSGNSYNTVSWTKDSVALPNHIGYTTSD